MNNADDRPKVGRDWIAFVVAWIPYSLLTYRFWHNIDDAFISFRYAKNWAMGYGPRYNLGPQQPEEGYSNFLWVVVCTFIEYLELNITFWVPMLGFACGSLLLYLVFRTLRRDLAMGLGVAFSLTLGLGLFPPYALWSTGGLGTMAFALSHLCDGLLSCFASGWHRALPWCACRRSHGVVAYRRHCLGFAHCPAWNRHPTDERGSGLATGGRLCRDRGHCFFSLFRMAIFLLPASFSQSGLRQGWFQSRSRTARLPLPGLFRSHICDAASFVAGGWLRGLAGSTETGIAYPWNLEPGISRLHLW